MTPAAARRVRRFPASAGTRGSRRTWLVLASALVLSACATPPRPAGADSTSTRSWAGRISLRVDQPQAQPTIASFELRGGPEAGEFSLFTPLGGTAARMTWSPGDARLEMDGKVSQYPSTRALTAQAIGTELPVESLFKWLAGEAAEAPGWTVKLDELPQGRLSARRTAPLPEVELRVVLDR